MGWIKFDRLSLLSKFLLTLALPLSIICFFVAVFTWISLKENAIQLASALVLQAKANHVLTLQQVQDDASKVMLLDISKLEEYSSRKIGAYDQHIQLLKELRSEVRDSKIIAVIDELYKLDESTLRPLDTQILETLFEDPAKSREMYFEKYEKPRSQYALWTKELEQLMSKKAEEARLEMEKKNEFSIMLISGALVLGIVVVLVVIVVLARRVEISEQNTKTLLAGLSDGLMFFDQKGVIAAERSQAMNNILPGSNRLGTIHDFLNHYCQTDPANVDACMKLLWSDKESDFLSDFYSTISFLPKQATLEIHGENRTFQFEYREINDRKGNLSKVFVVVTDVTDRLRDQREATLQAERVRKISKAAANISAYLAFISEMIGLFRSTDQLLAQEALTKEDEARLKRDLHTIKGSVAIFEFSGISSFIHEIETEMAENGMTPKVRSEWEMVKDRWKFETSDIETTLGIKKQQELISISKTKFFDIVEFAKTLGNGKLWNLLEETLRKPVNQLFVKYEDFLAKASQKIGDKQATMVYEADSSTLEEVEVQQIDAALLHIFRNALDHGIETKDLRLKHHKPEVGVITVAVYRRDHGGVHYVIRDDGAGIDGEKLANKAVKSGIWSKEQALQATHQQKLELIFVPNLSSKDQVTELSGRGVGMDVVRTLILGIGGSISVYSEMSRGTQFEIDVPKASTISMNQFSRAA